LPGALISDPASSARRASSPMCSSASGSSERRRIWRHHREHAVVIEQEQHPAVHAKNIGALLMHQRRQVFIRMLHREELSNGLQCPNRTGRRRFQRLLQSDRET
jgi:hypothetical protein